MPIEIKPYITAVLASLSCGIIGTYIVIRRLVFISGGITHASFGGIGIGYYLGWHPLAGALVAAVLSALGIEYTTRKGAMRNDSAIAIMWSLGMAIGIIFVYLTPGRPPNLMSYLFGSILVVSEAELFFLLLLDIVLITTFLVFYKPVIYVAFDRDFAKSRKYPVALIDYVMMVFIALTIVLNIRIVGIILVISLFTIPQNIANLFTLRNKPMFIFSVLISMAGTGMGIVLAGIIDVPTGATIILFLVAMYLLSRLLNRVFKI
ncbi:MAG: metal ABC transporter permease [Bacteroidetes bacterium]|nr:metal ABC transporter permease [Bacteroidota bacterium]